MLVKEAYGLIHTALYDKVELTKEYVHTINIVYHDLFVIHS